MQSLSAVNPAYCGDSRNTAFNQSGHKYVILTDSDSHASTTVHDHAVAVQPLPIVHHPSSWMDDSGRVVQHQVM